MNTVPYYIIILAGVSLNILSYQSNHIREVEQFRVRLSLSVVRLITATMWFTMIAFVGFTIYFGIKLGLLAAIKFFGLSILVQFPVAMIVYGLRLQRFAWAISLSGIVLLPLIVGIMVYLVFFR